MRYNFGDNRASGKAAEGGASISSNPTHHTPDHPPYSQTEQMVEMALRALAEEDGSTESSISAFIRSSYGNLPWAHDRLLPYYLRRLENAGELISPFPCRYKLQIERPPPRSRVRPALHGLNLCEPPSSLYLLRGNGRAPGRRGRGRPPLSEATTSYFNAGRGKQPRRLRGKGKIPYRLRGGWKPSLCQGGSPLRLRRSGDNMACQDAFMAGNAEGLYCLKGHDRQSAGFAFCGDGVLVDPVHSEVDVWHGQSSLVEGSNMMERELCESGAGLSSSVKGETFMTDEHPEPERGQCSLCTCLASMLDEQPIELHDEQSSQVKEPILMVDEQSEQDHGLSSRSKRTTLTVDEHPGLAHGRFLLVNKPTAMVVHEHSDLGNALCSAIKEPACMVEELSQFGNGSLETAETSFKESLPLVVPQMFERGTGESFHVEQQTLVAIDSSGRGQGNLLSELYEQGEQVRRETVKDPMNSQGKHSPGKGPSLVGIKDSEHGKELPLLPVTDVEEVEKGTVSSAGKRRRSRANQRRLWFEGC